MRYTPRSELEARLSVIQGKLRDNRIDMLFVVQKADLFYYTGTTQNGVFVVPATGKPSFFVRRSLTRAKTESAWDGVQKLDSMRQLPDLLAGEGYGRPSSIALEMDVVPARFYQQIDFLFPHAGLVDGSMLIREQRMIKSSYEVERIEGAAQQLHAVMEEIPSMLKVCRREIELAARIEMSLRMHRHQGLVRTRRFGLEMYYGAVSSGASASFPTDFDGPDGMEGLYPAVPQNGGERLLRPGDPIMVDLCGGYEGYIADKTRIYVLGGLQDEELVKAHEFALHIQSEIQGRMRPGARASHIYSEIDAMVKDANLGGDFMGYADNQSRFVGHGVGLELDELPVLTPQSKTVLAPGMVIAVEPKFFFGDRGGVGIENTWLITPDGCRNLTADNDDIVAV